MSKIEVKITADLSHLSDRDRLLIEKLKEAAPLFDDLYRKQVPKPGTSTYYPEGLTKEQFETYLEQHPDQRENLKDNRTVVRTGENGELTAIPYSIFYRKELAKIVAILTDAAHLCDHPGMKQFLLERAEAFEDNDFLASEYLWIALDSAPIELTIGADEEYDDTLLAVKRSFDLILGVVLPEENRRLSQYKAWAAEYDRDLAKRYGSKPNSAKRTMVIIDEVAGGGFSNVGYVPQAYNLPNETSIKQVAGSKQVFLRNIIRAKFEQMTRKIVERVLPAETAGRISFDDRVRGIVGHELAHGLGVYLKDGTRELGPMLEEAKADVFGILLLYWLADRGLIPAQEATSAALGEVADGLRQMRVGQTEAHAVGAVLQYRFLMACGALKISGNQLVLDEKLLREGQQKLGDAFADLALSKDYEKTKKFVEEWTRPIPELEPLLALLQDLPTDIIPKFE